MWRESVFVIFLLSSVTLIRAEAAKVTLGSTLETFAEFSLESVLASSETVEPGQVYIHSIQEDQWLSGNVLATVGSALYTIDSSGSSTLLTGSLEFNGFENGDFGTRFNKMSGILQMKSGREVILSDYWNNCLRKFDRETGEVTTFAGECDINYGTDSQGLPDCPTRRNGPLESATFCNPIRLRYREPDNTILVMDLAKHETYIRAIDLNTSMVSTLFYNNSFESRDFLDEEDMWSFVFSTAPGLLKMPSYSSYEQTGTWIAGCGNSSFHGDCPYSGTTNISMIHPHGLLKQNGVYVVSDFFGNEIYLVNPDYNKYARICYSNEYWYHYINHPTAVEIIGEYLYIGQHVHVNSYDYYTDYMTPQTIRIYRIKLSIIASYSSQWFERENDYVFTETTTANILEQTTTTKSPEARRCYIYSDCNERGYCSSTLGKCVCDYGYGGDFCTVKLCEDAYDCNEHGSCIEGQCLCNDGYSGTHCETRSECHDDSECSYHGSCSFGSCVCYEGYSGSYCENINKCNYDSDCNNHGTCSFSKCVCNYGYSGDYCDQASYCDDDYDCNDNGYCSKGTCYCYSSYSGNHCENAKVSSYYGSGESSSVEDVDDDDGFQYHAVVWPVTGGVFFIILAVILCCCRIARASSAVARPRVVSVTRIIGTKVAHRRLSETGSPQGDLLAVKRGQTAGVSASQRDATAVTVIQPPPYERVESDKGKPAVATVEPSP